VVKAHPDVQLILLFGLSLVMPVTLNSGGGVGAAYVGTIERGHNVICSSGSGRTRILVLYGQPNISRMFSFAFISVHQHEKHLRDVPGRLRQDVVGAAEEPL
jgi:hypothetical protein